MEKGPHATVPPLSTCMGCHTTVATEQPEIKKLKKHWDNDVPVPWVRIHRVPDHVYFTHQAHINAGLECQTCHGEVETMERVAQVRQLEMGDCVTCHRSEDIARATSEKGDYNAETKYQYLRYMKKDLKDKLLKSGEYNDIKGDFHDATGIKKFQNAPTSCDVCHQ